LLFVPLAVGVGRAYETCKRNDTQIKTKPQLQQKKWEFSPLSSQRAELGCSFFTICQGDALNVMKV